MEQKEIFRDIRPLNINGHMHGYTELYVDRGCWLKGMFKNNNEIGYIVENYVFSKTIYDEGTDIIFYIR